MKLFPLITAFAFFSECGAQSKSESRPNYDELKATIVSNQQQWHALALTSYQYRLAKNCFCNMTDFLINVRNGDIDVVVSNPESDCSAVVAAGAGGPFAWLIVTDINWLISAILPLGNHLKSIPKIVLHLNHSSNPIHYR